MKNALLVTLAICVFPITLRAQTSDVIEKVESHMKRSLKGLSGVTVAVSVDDDLKEWINEREMKTSIELALRKAKVRVVEPDDLLKNLNSAALVVSVIAVNTDNDAAAMVVQSRVYQMVIVPRLAKEPQFASTWESPPLAGVISKGPSFRQKFFDSLEKSTNEFLNAYLSAQE